MSMTRTLRDPPKICTKLRPEYPNRGFGVKEEEEGGGGGGGGDLLAC